jgi:hypothetical protein|tara:strand:- start:305 stop:637 length:333 start_codon:yes stop_codon:yes gene_type:complete
MATYEWKIISLLAYPEEAGETDVVFQVNWQCYASELKTNPEVPPYSATSVGSVEVTYEAGDPFTPYNQLTEEQVWQWVNPNIDRPALEANLQSMIDAEKTPATVNLPPPW